MATGGDAISSIRLATIVVGGFAERCRSARRGVWWRDQVLRTRYRASRTGLSVALRVVGLVRLLLVAARQEGATLCTLVLERAPAA